jgi:hypothetical protein
MLGGASNISHAGALVNQGRSLDSRGVAAGGGGAAGGGSAGDTSGGGGGGGGSGGGGPVDGGFEPGGAGAAAGISEQAAFQRAVWGPAGESQSDTVKSLFNLASGGASGMGAGSGSGSGSGSTPGVPPRPWTTECITINIDAIDKKQSGCLGYVSQSANGKFSDCGHMEHFCTVPATFGFRILFHVDYLGVPRPKPFTTPAVSIDLQFVIQEGGVDKVIFHQVQNDPHPVYVSPGMPLQTSFGSKFNISTNKNGKFRVKMESLDADTGIHLLYVDEIECVILPCV